MTYRRHQEEAEETRPMKRSQGKLDISIGDKGTGKNLDSPGVLCLPNALTQVVEVVVISNCKTIPRYNPKINNEEAELK